MTVHWYLMSINYLIAAISHSLTDKNKVTSSLVWICFKIHGNNIYSSQPSTCFTMGINSVRENKRAIGLIDYLIYQLNYFQFHFFKLLHISYLSDLHQGNHLCHISAFFGGGSFFSLSGF